MTKETLTMEQLDEVAGGTHAEDCVDITFLQQLDYNMARTSLEDAFADNGVKYSTHWSSKQNNDYIILGQKYPHVAALGYVLKKRNYPGFNGNGTDSKNVHSFLKDHFHITDCG